MSWVLSALMACTGSDAEAPPDDVVEATGDTGAPALAASLTWAEHVPAVAIVTVTTAEGATAWVEYGLDDALDRATPAVDGPDVQLPLLGLKAGRTYSWRAVSEGAAGRVEGPTQTLTALERPQGLPRLEVEATGPSAMDEGYVLVSVTSALGGPTAEAWLAIYDGDGDPVWWRKHPSGHVTVSPTQGTTPGTVLWDRYDMRDTNLWAVAQQVSLDGTTFAEAPLSQGHHGVVEPEPGVLAWIARELRENPYGPGHVTADRLYEAPADATRAPRQVVGLYDDLFGGAFSSPCEHPQLGLVFEELFPVYEWSHLNSLAYLPDRDAYLLNVRWTDTLVLVDRASGQILWQLGGPDSDFRLPGGAAPWVSAEDTVLSHAHFSEAWDGGLVAFDNGSHRQPQVSSLVELAWSETTGTVEEVFRWEDPEGRYLAALGDVRRVPGGYLASWSTAGELTVVDPSGALLWKGTAQPQRAMSRLVYLPDLYAWLR